MHPGHVLIDLAGRLCAVDRHFCAIMRAQAADVIGRPVLDITAPADRQECGDAIRALRDSGRSFRLSKRFLRDDGTLVWVTNIVSTLSGLDGDTLIVATIDPMVLDEIRQPALLLDGAHFLEAYKSDRRSVFDPALFADTAWDVILAAYITEAEGNALSIADLATRLGLPRDRIARWVAALLDQGALEIETRRADAHSAKCFRLTGATHRTLEEHLARISGMMPAPADARRRSTAA